MKQKKIHLVCQHLERVHRNVLEKHQDILRQLIRHRHGIYALYKGARLNYVGLADNLRGRLKAHLRDRHKKNWDHFSIYLTIEASHLQELEALAIRIASPEENRQKGNLKKSESLLKLLNNAIKKRQEEERRELLGGITRKSIAQESLNRPVKGRKPVMVGLVKNGEKLRFSYKGKTYKAFLKKNGTIRYKRKIYYSPSAAAFKITRRGVDGWYAWKYERAPGDWVPINELRK